MWLASEQVQDGRLSQVPVYRSTLHGSSSSSRSPSRNAPFLLSHKYLLVSFRLTTCTLIPDSQCPASLTMPRFPDAGLQSIAKHEGIRQLYAGLFPNLVGSTVSWGLYFYGYNRLREMARYLLSTSSARFSLCPRRTHAMPAYDTLLAQVYLSMHSTS